MKNKPLTDKSYEKYLSKEENRKILSRLWVALENGKVLVEDMEYFLLNKNWEGSNNDNKLITTFFIPFAIPKQYIQLEINKNTKQLSKGESRLIFGDYIFQLNIAIKKELIPLFDNNIIKILE